MTQFKRYSDYDDFAWAYNKHWWHFSSKILPILDKLILCNIPQNGNILDLCCGTGHLAKALQNRGYNVTGIDGSEEMISFARENSPNSHFVVEDARAFNSPSKFHAVVSLFDSLNHIMELNELKKVFGNVFSALIPEGIFMFDLNMEEGFKKLWSASSFNIVQDDNVCAIRASYDPEKKIGISDITIFRFRDQWKRTDVSLLQKCYSENDIISTMRQVGFENVQALDHRKDLGSKEIGRTFFIGNKYDKKQLKRCT